MTGEIFTDFIGEGVSDFHCVRTEGVYFYAFHMIIRI